jgi:DNA-binding response OmpR family regulator
MGRRAMRSSQPVVLLLEDDTATRELYRRELGRTFFVVACGSEQDAAEHLGTISVDALVLEPAALSNQTWSFVARLRRQHPDLPIVVCSILDVRGRSAELGACAYLIKPVTPALLANTLSTVLGD